MDIGSKYSIETVPKILQEGGQIVELLGYLVQHAVNSEVIQKEMRNELSIMRKTTDDINSKIDVVLDKLNNLENDFSDFKNEERDVDEKLFFLSAKLDKLELKSQDIDTYYALAQRTYMNWDDFDDLTKQFIPVADYLFSKLQNYEKQDYSPVILELCRAFENEILLKVFRKYILELLDREGDNLDDFLFSDRAFCKETETMSFVLSITRAKKTRKPEITLGQMYFVLLSCCNSTKLSLSPLLRDFKHYLEKNTKSKQLLDSSYIEKIHELVDEFRNPSAHPNIMPKKKAQKCREIMPDRLDYFVDCVLPNK